MSVAREISPARLWDGLLGVSLAAIVAIAAIGLLSRPQKSAPPTNNHGKLIAIQSATSDLEDKLEEAQQTIAARTWKMSPEAIGSNVLADCNVLCEKHHLTITRFRVATPIAAPNLIEAPLTLVVEGAFLDVMALVKSLEGPDSKVAVSELRVNRSNNATTVSANMSLTAFIYKEAK